MILFPLARRFIAGQSLEGAFPKVLAIAGNGFRITLDCLGENVTDRGMVEGAARDYLLALQALAARGLDCNISIKLTQIGLDIDEELCREQLHRITAEAARLKGFVRVDMEGSAYTERTLKLVQEVHRQLPCVGAVIQAMLKRSPLDVDLFIAAGIPVRLVKGAYKEPATIALADKRAVDRQFIELMERLLADDGYHAIATHDAPIIAHAKAIAKARGLAPDRFEFQMLLGIRESLQQQLLAEGWRVRVYIPYGSAWLPYVLRRVRERKENLWFVLKNVLKG
ncbi:MAG: proline dehydrogenase family protein [Deltaproteobacteria bacterium]|nr:proline dehydrogenase family protein [Deltaproteobacteria bacterium]